MSFKSLVSLEHSHVHRTYVKDRINVVPFFYFIISCGQVNLTQLRYYIAYALFICTHTGSFPSLGKIMKKLIQ